MQIFSMRRWAKPMTLESNRKGEVMFINMTNFQHDLVDWAIAAISLDTDVEHFDPPRHGPIDFAEWDKDILKRLVHFLIFEAEEQIRNDRQAESEEALDFEVEACKVLLKAIFASVVGLDIGT